MPRTTAGVRLADLTTLRLGGPARSLVTVTDEAELADALTDDALVLGGGSNLVVADAGIDAPVVRIAIPGITQDSGDGDADTVTIGAGENWDEVVQRLVDDGRCGLAPLSGIPGSTGATPVQNVGAYGTEVSDLLVSVRVVDRRTRRAATLPAAELGLGYRTSALRGTGLAVVTAVTFRLPRTPAPVRYAELARALGVQPGEVADERDVREAVLTLRRSKGMVLDPADPDSRSAGSFFTNPILDAAGWAAARDRIAERLGDVPVPHYPAGEGVKLSAAWLIERAGFHRGHRGPGGRVGVSGKHTLALVTRDGGTTADLVELAADIRDRVLDLFAVRLEPEPVFVGVALPTTDRRPPTADRRPTTADRRPPTDDR
ncbi:UDP-N-acetylmuramate dehydrogenase [Nakamurella endophytica]|uniref:UDP-N-acetylmuramate dehydrogenase n=1 Tax=Nakamurella endophytica TaxID=1748367 RepID=UPI001E541CBF|nr:UDP-N-acetylmuramate dehydrogenase [Nakamurella endophytica]